MKNLLKIVYFWGIFAYVKADCGIDLNRANLHENDIVGNNYLNLTDQRIESKYLTLLDSDSK
jgi:hypothetical protein